MDPIRSFSSVFWPFYCRNSGFQDNTVLYIVQLLYTAKKEKFTNKKKSYQNMLYAMFLFHFSIVLVQMLTALWRNFPLVLS